MMRENKNNKPKMRLFRRFCFSLVFLIIFGIFSYSAFKFTDSLWTAYKEQKAFDELADLAVQNGPAGDSSEKESDNSNKSTQKRRGNDTSDAETISGNDISGAETISANDVSGTEKINSNDKSSAGNNAGDTNGTSGKDQDDSSDSRIKAGTIRQYQALYDMNQEFFGWLSIDGTNINYPVMYSPSRPEYYLRHAFDGSYSRSGVPFLDSRCNTDGNCYLIYGHNMKNNTMFGQLLNYSKKSFYENHPIIRLNTCFDQREYQISAVFYSRVYGQNDSKAFRYYAYTDLTDQSVFEEYIEQVYASSIYNTGVNIRYGDELLVLSTCSYHVENGRFVVLARKID